MKTIKTIKFLLATILLIMAATVNAQTIVVYKNDKMTMAINAADVDSVVYKNVSDEGYYYYAGWTEPTAKNMKEIINEEYPVSSTDQTMHKAGGWVPMLTEFSMTKPLKEYNINLYNAKAKDYYYILVPDGVNVYAGIGPCLLTNGSFVLHSSFNDHRVYKSTNTTRNICDIYFF